MFLESQVGTVTYKDLIFEILFGLEWVKYNGNEEAVLIEIKDFVDQKHQDLVKH